MEAPPNPSSPADSGPWPPPSFQPPPVAAASSPASARAVGCWVAFVGAWGLASALLWSAEAFKFGRVMDVPIGGHYWQPHRDETYDLFSMVLPLLVPCMAATAMAVALNWGRRRSVGAFAVAAVLGLVAVAGSVVVLTRPIEVTCSPDGRGGLLGPTAGQVVEPCPPATERAWVEEYESYRTRDSIALVSLGGICVVISAGAFIAATVNRHPGSVDRATRR